MKFYIVDVFAEKKYQGNQLAVFLPEAEISTEMMQKMAREINFSESSFILSNKQKNGGYDVRIFTPDVEVPFAGHPTLGTAFAISRILEKAESPEVILNLSAGQIPVSIEKDHLTMVQNQPSFGMTVEQPEVLAEVLSIDLEDIRTDYPIEWVSTGLPCFVVPLKSIETVKRCSINHERFKHFFKTYDKCNLLVFAEECECVLRVRVFMDDPGFLEDPATGSANGNLACYLLEHDFYGKDNIDLEIKQGYEIGRPSRIKIVADKANDRFRTSVGGNVHLVATGEWL